MVKYKKVPIAWLILTENKKRLFSSLAGVCVAIFLIFMQIGFRSAFFNGVVELAYRFNADLVMIHVNKISLAKERDFSRRLLYSALEVDGVESANPLYIQKLNWKNLDTNKICFIRTIGLNPNKEILAIPGVSKYREALSMPNTVIIDVKSKSKFYGNPESGMPAELARRNIDVVGTFSLGTDFIFVGNVIMNELNYAKFSPASLIGNDDLIEKNINVLSKVDIGLIKINPDADPVRIKESIKSILPDNIEILTKEEFIKREKSYWQKRTPVGIILGLGTAIGFFVGVIICYQILYTDVVDNITEFATLKAIGYNNKDVAMVVIKEALFLSILGFFPSLLFSKLSYNFIGDVTGLPFELTMIQIFAVFCLTIGMCMISGIIAISKLITADPAEIF